MRKLSMWPRSDAWASRCSSTVRPQNISRLRYDSPSHHPRHPGLVDHYAEALTALQDDPHNRRSSHNINKERTEAVSDSDRMVSR